MHCHRHNLPREQPAQLNAALSPAQVELEHTTMAKVDLKTEPEQVRLCMTVEKADTNWLVEETRKELLDGMKAKVVAEQELAQM